MICQKDKEDFFLLIEWKEGYQQTGEAVVQNLILPASSQGIKISPKERKGALPLKY